MTQDERELEALDVCKWLLYLASKEANMAIVIPALTLQHLVDRAERPHD